METHRILAAAVATVVLTSASQAEVFMDVSASRVYYQQNAFRLDFNGGALDVSMRDGNFVFDASCPLNGSPVFFPPSTVPSCELGATGFVASGDLDGDGIRDDNQYWSIVNNGVVPARTVEPSRPDLAVLRAGPPSKLPRPLYNFKDETVVVFYNIRAAVTDYHLTWYTLNRPYLSSELKRMDEEIVPGQYLFTFPHLDYPDLTPVAMGVTIAPMLNALDPTSRSRAGFRFTSGSWYQTDYQMDPRLITPITWTGNDRTIVRNGDQIFFSILNETESGIAFPPSVPENPVLLPTPLAQNYNLAPFFFVVGDRGVMNLAYNRLLPSSGIAYDSSTRDFRAKVVFVDSFAGYVQTSFPSGVSSRDRSAKADYDKDGMSNGDEYAFQAITNEEVNRAAKSVFVPFSIDPDSALGIRPTLLRHFSLGGPPPNTPAIAVSEKYHSLVTVTPEPITDPSVKPALPAPTTVDEEGHAVFEVPVRPNTGNTVKYQFQEAAAVGKKKGKKIKLADWNLEKVVTTATENRTIRIEVLTTLDTLAFFTAPVEIEYNTEALRLTSKVPAPDPLNLPKIVVQATPTALK